MDDINHFEKIMPKGNVMDDLEAISEKETKNSSSRKKLVVLAIVGFFLASLVISLYLYMSRNRIYVEKCYIEAPLIALSSQNGGTLEKVMVVKGDKVKSNQIVAQVGQELVKSKKDGLIVSADDQIGKKFAPMEAVATMIDPLDLRLSARVEEDKGLSDIRVGEKVFFTVDSFGSKKYEGVVDEIAPASRESDVVFNISSQREVKEFEVKIRFDQKKYPELKNGMSAKAWIYKN